MKKMHSKELLIGVSVLLTLLILFFGIDYLKGINLFHSANYYYATFTNVDGLAQSAPVTCNGFKVGQVKEIQYEYDNPGHVRVELSLDKALKVPRGSQAVLVTDLLGTGSIELRMSSSTDYHTVGEMLQGVNNPSLMEGVGSTLIDPVSRLLPHIDSLVVSVTALTTDPALLGAVRRLDNVMANLEESTAYLAKVMQTTPAIAAGAQTTLTNVGEMSANLARISADLTVVSEQLRTAPIDSTFAHLARISRNIDEITATVNSPNSSLGLLLRDPALYDNLNGAASRVDSILIDLQRCPKRYIPPIKLF